jgi:hypothetical protein
MGQSQGAAQSRQLTIHRRRSDLLPPFLDVLLNQGLIDSVEGCARKGRELQEPG